VVWLAGGCCADDESMCRIYTRGAEVHGLHACWQGNASLGAHAEGLRRAWQRAGLVTSLACGNEWHAAA
jgi:hypothetical protein